MVFPLGSCVLIWAFIPAGSSAGEIISFHLMCCQLGILQRQTYHYLLPSHPQERIFILGINPVLNATESAVAIVIQCGGDFCGPRVRIV